MRRLLPATVAVVLFASGCGRSGPLTEARRPGTLDVISNPAAGAVEIEVNGALAATCPGDCDVDFPAQAAVELRAIAGDGDFAEWTEDVAECGAASSCSFTPSGDTTAGATWTATILVSNTSGLGRVVSVGGNIDCGTVCAFPFPFGDGVALDAVPDPGFFRSWGGACADQGTGLSCTVVADTSRSIVADFSAFSATLSGAALDQFGEAITADPLDPGGYFLSGSFEGTFVLGSAELLHSAGELDGFFARVGADGIATWSETIATLTGGRVHPHAIAAAVDGADLACFVGGSFEGSADIVGDGATADEQGDINAFLLRQNAGAATRAWADIGVGGAAGGRSMIADIDYLDGTLAIAGTISEAVTLGGTPFDTTNQNRHHVLTALVGVDDGQLDQDVLHGRAAGSHVEGRGVALLVGGDPVTASFYELLDDVGPCDLPSDAATNDGFLFKMDGSDFANCDWERRLDLDGDDRLFGLVAGAGRLVTVGARIDGTGSVRVQEIDAVNGTLGWTASFPTTAPPLPFGIAHDAARGEVVLAGSFAGTIRVGLVDYVSVAGFDVIVVRLDETDGSVVSVATTGGDADDVVGGPDVAIGGTDFNDFDMGYAAGAITILGNGNVAVTGWTRSTTFEGVTTSGGADLFVLRVAPFP